MAYVPCTSCGRNHRNVKQADVVRILIAFQEGNGQIVTRAGIEPLCILDMLEMSELARNQMENHHAQAANRYAIV